MDIVIGIIISGVLITTLMALVVMMGGMLGEGSGKSNLGEGTSAGP